MPTDEIINAKTDNEILAEKLATAIKAVLQKIIQREIELTPQKYEKQN